jgi:uncharacterized membrane protein
MFATSKDILFIVLAVCIFGFTVFVCWGIYYFIAIIRQMNETIKDFREKMQRFENFLTVIEEKIKHSTSYLILFAEGIKEVLSFLRDRKDAKKSKKE